VIASGDSDVLDRLPQVESKRPSGPSAINLVLLAEVSAAGVSLRTAGSVRAMLHGLTLAQSRLPRNGLSSRRSRPRMKR